MMMGLEEEESTEEEEESVPQRIPTKIATKNTPTTQTKTSGSTKTITPTLPAKSPAIVVTKATLPAVVSKSSGLTGTVNKSSEPSPSSSIKNIQSQSTIVNKTRVSEHNAATSHEPTNISDSSNASNITINPTGESFSAASKPQVTVTPEDFARRRLKRKKSSHLDDNSSLCSSTDEDEIPEMLVPNRARRLTAGNKMAELLKTSTFNDDTFYTEAYGGFVEDEQDDNYESPPNSSGDDEDEVDSDFDIPEQESDGDADEEFDVVEESERTRRKTDKQNLLAKHKNWAKARFARLTVQENTCDARTQQQRLIEAKKTVELNLSSLKRFEEFEIERKRRNTKPSQKKAPIGSGPRVHELFKPDGTSIIIVPNIQEFNRPPPREFRTCAISKQRANYIDPYTKLPYANADAFKILRQTYNAFLATADDKDDYIVPDDDIYQRSITPVNGDAQPEKLKRV